MELTVGQKVRFIDEEGQWTVRAVSGRWAIMTAIGSKSKQRWYTIYDRETEMRGPHNLIFNFFDTSRPSGIREMMQYMTTDGQLSRRSIPARFDERARVN